METTLVFIVTQKKSEGGGTMTKYEFVGDMKLMPALLEYIWREFAKRLKFY
jgi:hypothetical protein